MRRILVTGGAGFIGSHVVDLLCQSQHEVHVIDNFSTGNKANLSGAEAAYSCLQVYDADITTRRAAELVQNISPDAIIHLAAQFSVKVSMSDPLLDAHVNVVGLVNILEAARRSQCRKVVFASSGGTIYGDETAAPLPTKETSVRQPQSFYGLTKSVSIDYLQMYKQHFGMDYVAIALGNVYGPRQSPLGEAGVVSIFAGKLLNGQQCVINGDGKTTRDYVHVSDVARAFALAIDKGSGLINVAAAVERDVQEVHETVSKMVERDDTPIYGQPLTGEVRRVCLDIAKAKQELSWTPTVPFDVGVRSVVDWLRNESHTERKQ